MSRETLQVVLLYIKLLKCNIVENIK